jgi:hypothetical protein
VGSSSVCESLDTGHPPLLHVFGRRKRLQTWALTLLPSPFLGNLRLRLSSAGHGCCPVLSATRKPASLSHFITAGQLFCSHRSLSQSVFQGQLPLWNLEARAVFGEILRLAVQACSVPYSWCNAGLFPGEACPTLLPQADRCALATSFPSSFPMVPSTAASSARWGKARARFCDCTHPAVGVSQTTFLPLFPEPQEHR